MVKNTFSFSLQGLKVGDSVLQFGSLTAENFKGLQNIAAVVQHSIDVSRTSVDNRISKHRCKKRSF